MRILVTGGPVHAKLDPVKMITNRFKGGQMVAITEELVQPGTMVCYLCADSLKGSQALEELRFMATRPLDEYGKVEIVFHDGLDDYMAKVLELAPEMDAVVLGAAVVNLVPVCYYQGGFVHEGEVGRAELYSPVPMPLEGKFPSHDYKPGDRIFMEWTIAERVIDKVKAVMKPTAHLFGFKLLSGYSKKELCDAAYGVLMESKATCVFANDPSVESGITKYAVMKDRSVHEMGLTYVAHFITRIMEDEYYHTERISAIHPDNMMVHVNAAESWVDELIEKHKDEFVESAFGHIFGTVAARIGETESFITTARGKKELDGRVQVVHVDHDKHTVQATNHATLNAPLLHWIFHMYPEVTAIVHVHLIFPDWPDYPYAPPGTKRDSTRGIPCKSFNVYGHGSFRLLNKDGETL